MSKNYTRYVVVGLARSGTNLLNVSLKNHSQIRAYYELFHQDQTIVGPYKNDMYSLEDFNRIRNEDPTRFLEECVFREYNPQIKAVGFKFLCNQFMKKKNEFFKKYVSEDKTLKILKVRRGNYLDIVVSKKIALMTGEWMVVKGEPQEKISPFIFEYDELRHKLENTIKLEHSVFTELEKHENLEIWYQDVLDDYDREMQRVQSFLQVDFEKMTSDTVKQNQKKISEIILNYADLKKKFSGSIYEAFFEE